MKYLIGLIMAALLFSSVGCGHRKSGVPESLSKGQNTRALVAGDKMVYDLDVNWEDAKGAPLGSKQGTVTIEVQKGFKHGPVPADIKKTYHVSEQLEGQGSPTAQINWMGQDAKGALYLLGRLDQSKDWALVTDKAIKPDIPDVLSDGASWGYTVHLSNGKTETNTYKIVGTEKVTTPAGDFQAYKTKTETKVSDGTVATGHVWLRPEFPRGVKLELKITNTKSAKKVTTHLSQLMKSYKLAE